MKNKPSHFVKRKWRKLPELSKEYDEVLSLHLSSLLNITIGTEKKRSCHKHVNRARQFDSKRKSHLFQIFLPK